MKLYTYIFRQRDHTTPPHHPGTRLRIASIIITSPIVSTLGPESRKVPSCLRVCV